MLKVSRGPEIVNELFQFREQISYNLRQRPVSNPLGFLVVQKALHFLGGRYGQGSA